MLVMDDVHWADEPTLLLIEHMAKLMPNIRVLGVGTYRDVELEVSAAAGRDPGAASPGPAGGAHRAEALRPQR